jgi:hypothetical protein
MELVLWQMILGMASAFRVQPTQPLLLSAANVVWCKASRQAVCCDSHSQCSTVACTVAAAPSAHLGLRPHMAASNGLWWQAAGCHLFVQSPM